MLLFLEYDFTIMYKPSRTHVVANALSRLPNIIEPIGVLNQITYASFFLHKAWMVEWCKRIFENWIDEGTLSI